MPLRFSADEVAVAGGEDGFTVPVLVELGSRGLRNRCHHSPGKDQQPGIISEPLPRFRIQPVPQLLYSHDGNSHPFVMPVYENAAPAPIPGTLAGASPTIRGHYGRADDGEAEETTLSPPRPSPHHEPPKGNPCHLVRSLFPVPAEKELLLIDE